LLDWEQSENHLDETANMAVDDVEGVAPPRKEKGLKHGDPNMEVAEGKQEEAGGWRGIMSMLEKRGDIEFGGCTPIPCEERTETNYFNIFTLWFSMSCNPLPYVAHRTS
jgi:hypothetical protein